MRENPQGFSAEELEIVSSWKHFVKSRFYIVRFLKDHAVFMDEGRSPKAYGVKGLAMQWELIGNLPRIVQATLLPFKGKIIFDGSFSCYNLFFGSPSGEEKARPHIPPEEKIDPLSERPEAAAFNFAHPIF